MSWEQSVWDVVESLRTRHEILQPESLPIDILSFVELDLRLDIVPYDGLSSLGADAAIMGDFSGIYVDSKTYDLIDTAPEWKLNRLRFSLAHEVGHLLLHKEAFERAGIHLDHFLDWINEHNGHKYDIEKQANEFAGRLLVPRDNLLADFNMMARGMDGIMGRHEWLRDPEMRQKVCDRICGKYGVHHKAVSTRLDREGIWPSFY